MHPRSHGEHLSVNVWHITMCRRCSRSVMPTQYRTVRCLCFLYIYKNVLDSNFKVGYQMHERPSSVGQRYRVHRPRESSKPIQQRFTNIVSQSRRSSGAAAQAHDTCRKHTPTPSNCGATAVWYALICCALVANTAHISIKSIRWSFGPTASIQLAVNNA